jgi:hypothetical protein
LHVGFVVEIINYNKVRAAFKGQTINQIASTIYVK